MNYVHSVSTFVGVSKTFAHVASLSCSIALPTAGRDPQRFCSSVFCYTARQPDLGTLFFLGQKEVLDAKL